MNDLYSKCAKYFLQHENDKIYKLMGNIALGEEDEDVAD